MSERTQKLVMLRARTDHDVLILVERELDRCRTLVNAATASNSARFAQAERSLTTAEALLPRIAELNRGDQLRIEAKLEQLRSLLDQVSLNDDRVCVSFAS